ncbi:thermonuclease family protein [Glaciecola sp. KUL10]|uniref:thermonuclease family protein n=1 Tax=Glaciecola sp. (strain KUL10) TaxID=2161813 RepID=UPI000D78A709|nr:thermonuclease family protein [Glaciecola sp. KUL10]GBL03622.1 nuclease-like protein [Glaciecola sp. KUL10]
MRYGLSLAAFLLVSAISACQRQGIDEYRVVKFIDGDTIVLNDDEGTRIDLALIDAPEIEQPFGRDARQGLESLIQDNRVQIQYMNNGKALVYLDSILINEKLVQKGYAWFDISAAPEPAMSIRLKDSQSEATSRKIGLWAQNDTLIVSPWQWRADGKEVVRNSNQIRFAQQREAERRRMELQKITDKRREANAPNRSKLITTKDD